MKLLIVEDEHKTREYLSKGLVSPGLLLMQSKMVLQACIWPQLKTMI